MNKHQLRNSFLLLITAFIWGFAFAAQSVGMQYIGPFTFCFVRYIIGGAVLIPVAYISGRGRHDDIKTLITGGICCGTALGIASLLQQFALLSAPVGKAGFVTALYIIGVPIIGSFFGRRCSVTVWIAVIAAIAGLYLLCVDGSLSLQSSDILLILCALMFSVQILFIDRFSPLVNNVKLSCIQFFTAAVIGGIPMLLFEAPDMGALRSAWMPVLYTGLLSTGVAYTLQIIGQKGVNPTVASLIMSLESSISVLAGWLILGQKLTPQQFAGCGIMLFATVLAQLPKKEQTTGKYHEKTKA